MTDTKYHEHFRRKTERPEDCIVIVPQLRGFSGQCGNKRGKGPKGLYCGTHALKLKRDEENSKKCWQCKDTGHHIVPMPTKFHCSACKKKCSDRNCKAKKL